MIPQRLAVLIVAFAVAGVFFIIECDWIYDCGCRAWWNGAAEHCNIHNAEGPRCPWCVQGGIGGYASFTLIVLGQIAVCFSRREMSLKRRFFFALLTLPILGSLSALVLGWFTGYWAG